MSAFPQLPKLAEMRPIALEWALKQTEYHTDELKEMLRQHFKLSRRHLALTMSNGTNAFSNRVDWLTARWTMEGVHRGENKVYRLTARGLREARNLFATERTAQSA